jgi:transcriptional regulator with XRE-family HTH domain
MPYGIYRYMTLVEYLARHNLSKSDFGRRIGTASGTVSRWTTGRRLPALSFVVKIEAATGGWVTARDFFVADECDSGLPDMAVEQASSADA